jgi:hypothetical protein
MWIHAGIVGEGYQRSAGGCLSFPTNNWQGFPDEFRSTTLPGISRLLNPNTLHPWG